MTKRTCKIAVLAILVVVCLFATTLITACNKESSYYLSTSSNNWATYKDAGDVPANVKFNDNNDGTYSLTVDLTAGDSFAIYKIGSTDNLVKEIFSANNKLALSNGKVTVADSGKYVLTLDVSSGELSYSFTPSNIPVTGVTVQPTLALTVGEADKTLTPNVLPTNATNKNVTWKSSEPTVATVSDDGVVHAVTQGNAVITVTTVDGEFTAECKVTVSNAQQTTTLITGLRILDQTTNEEVTSSNLTEDDVARFYVEVLPNTANETYSVEEISNNGVVNASVNAGVLTVQALKEGTAQIKLVSQSGGAESEVLEINVSAKAEVPKKVETIYFEEDDSTLTLVTNPTIILNVVVDPDDADDKTFTWTVNNEGIVNIQRVQGQDFQLEVTAVTVGTVTITLVSNSNGEAETIPLTITVQAPEATGVEITSTDFTLGTDGNDKTLEMEIGDSGALVATILPAGAAGNVTWSSSADSIVSVDQDGNIEALAAGPATIRAEVSGNVYALVKITVVKHVTGIELNQTSYTLYGTDDNFDLTVTFTPADATNQNYTIEVYKEGTKLDAENGIISYNAVGKTISITALAYGTVTLKVISVDNGEATASCEITVSDSDAVPQLSTESVTIKELDKTSEIIAINYAGGSITDFTVTPNSDDIVSVNKGENSFTLSSKGFGTTSVTVAINYGNDKTINLSLQVSVYSAYFYLVGSADGNNGWTQQTSEENARKAGMLLEYVEEGKYELTRELTKGYRFYIVPAALDQNWNYALKADGYYTGSNSYVTSAGGGNMQVTYAGEYKITLDITGSKAAWYVEWVTLYPEDASISVDNNELTYNSATNVAEFSVTIDPVDATANIAWSFAGVDSSWLQVEDNGSTYTVKLINFVGTSNVQLTVTVTISGSGFNTITKDKTITLIPEGGAKTPVNDIQWDTSSAGYNADSKSYAFNVDEGYNNIAVVAKVNSDASNQNIIYSIVSGGDVMYNDGATNAFAINAENGKITAYGLGTIKVRATAADDDSYYKEIDVLIYSNNLMIAGKYSGAIDGNWGNNPMTKFGSKNDANNVFTWTGLKLYKGDVLVFLYSSGDWNRFAIRSVSYLDSASSSNVGGTKGSASNDGGQFTVSNDGVYTITINLTGSTPLVTFNRTGNIEVESGWTKEVSVKIVSNGNTWTAFGDYTFSEGSGTVSEENPSYTLRVKFDNDNKFDNVKLDGGNMWFGLVVNGSWYDDKSSNGFNWSGTAYNGGWASGKWYNWSGNDRVAYIGNVKGLEFDFVFTFTSTGALTGIAINTVS